MYRTRLPHASECTAQLAGSANLNGGFVSNSALCGSMPPRQADIVRIRQRMSRTAAEIGYDILTWFCGLLAAAWVTRDVASAAVLQYFAVRAAGALCVLSPASGLLAGLYRSRNQRGSLHEVIAIARASGSAIRDLTAEAERCGLVPKVIPSITELLSGVARIEGVRDPRISDLLGRRPVETDVASVAGHFAGKRILVTGAGGSIGSELCRQLHRFEPAELIMLDRDESALHAVQLALHGRALLDTDGSVLADIRDPRRIRQVFEQFQPQIVFHAAALKHLPLLERYPAEALKTNVWGTWTVLEAAAACGAASFVNISTD